MAGWHSFPQSPGLRPGACMGLCCHRAAGIEAPSASWGTVTWRTKWPRAGLKRCRLSLGGMDGGVAFVPAVPGLAPWGFYKARGGVARANLDGLASKRRQDAEAQRARSERRQDAEANVRRDGTGNPDPPRTLLRANLDGLSTASRRPLDGLSMASRWPLDGLSMASRWPLVCRGQLAGRRAGQAAPSRSAGGISSCVPGTSETRGSRLRFQAKSAR